MNPCRVVPPLSSSSRKLYTWGFGHFCRTRDGGGRKSVKTTKCFNFRLHFYERVVVTSTPLQQQRKHIESHFQSHTLTQRKAALNTSSILLLPRNSSVDLMWDLILCSVFLLLLLLPYPFKSLSIILSSVQLKPRDLQNISADQEYE